MTDVSPYSFRFPFHIELEFLAFGQTMDKLVIVGGKTYRGVPGQSQPMLWREWVGCKVWAKVRAPPH